MGYMENSYLSFAENDHCFFRDAYDHGIRGGALAALGQSICERYLKHIISEYANPETDLEQHRKERALHTHNLQVLMKYIQEEMGICIPEETEESLDRINGFYFTTRYPGDDSFIPSERDISKADTAVESARHFVLQICREMERGEAKEEEGGLER